MVIDEYHKSAAETYQKIFAKLPNTKYRLGLTATVDRDDGKSPILFANIGKTIYSISTKNLIEQGYLVKPNITFIRVPENHFSGEKYPEDYSENIVNNDYRNAKILHLASQDKKTLILTKMLIHGHSLNKMISGSRFIYGSLSAQNRTEAMQWFRETEGAVMIMTLSIGAEGLDIPDLDVIINAAANKGDVKSIQVLGRVLRIFQGKSEAQYIDFVDAGPHTRKHSNARIKAFKAQEHDVNTVD